MAKIAVAQWIKIRYKNVGSILYIAKSCGDCFNKVFK